MKKLRRQNKTLSKYVERVRSERSAGFVWKNGRLVSGEHEPEGVPSSCTRALLGIVWADSEFWKMLARPAAAQEITDYVKEHRLQC